eukprot:m.886948 g.886948  ORF g.886948 m.886948 type:complete len:67 (+) comp23632_c0_seq3:89-289(+)
MHLITRVCCGCELSGILYEWGTRTKSEVVVEADFTADSPLRYRLKDSSALVWFAFVNLIQDLASYP